MLSGQPEFDAPARKPLVAVLSLSQCFLLSLLKMTAPLVQFVGLVRDLYIPFPGKVAAQMVTRGRQR